VAAGGIIANRDVHGVKADLHLEQLWDRNIAIITRLVDTVTTPMLLKTVQSHRIDPEQLFTHRFKLDEISDAYETFGAAAKTNALKDRGLGILVHCAHRASPAVCMFLPVRDGSTPRLSTCAPRHGRCFESPEMGLGGKQDATCQG